MTYRFKRYTLLFLFTLAGLLVLPAGAIAQACFADGSRIKSYSAGSGIKEVQLATGSHTLTVSARGGAGGGATGNVNWANGYEREAPTGATVTATFDVNIAAGDPEGKLVLFPGSTGDSGSPYRISGETGRYYNASGGGGASAVLLATQGTDQLLLVAGGAGGNAARGYPNEEDQPGQATLSTEPSGGARGYRSIYTSGGGGGFGARGGGFADSRHGESMAGGGAGMLRNADGLYRLSRGGSAECGFECNGEDGGGGFGGGGAGGGKERSNSGSGGGGGGYRGGDGGGSFIGAGKGGTSYVLTGGSYNGRAVPQFTFDGYVDGKTPAEAEIVLSCTDSGLIKLYVDASATGAADGSSWQNAFNELQDALAALDTAATTGLLRAQIWVAGGTYTPDLGAGQTAGERTSTFTIPDYTTVYGGFAGTETARDQRDPEANVTTLSGDLGFANFQGDNAYTVVTLGTRGVTLDGFTISDGYNGDTSSESGGIRAEEIESSAPLPNELTLSNLLVTENTAGSGGGLHVTTSGRVSLSNVTFSGNTALTSNGGAYIAGSPNRVSFSNVQFTENTAAESVGGLRIAGSDTVSLAQATFTSNAAGTAVGGAWIAGSNAPDSWADLRFEDNTAGSANTGGLYLSAISPVMVRARFAGNTAPGGNGGAVYAAGGASPQFVSVAFTGNRARAGGAYYSQDAGASPAFVNALFSGNRAIALEGGAAYLSGADALFLNATIVNNRSSRRGGGIYAVLDNNVVAVHNSILWGNRDGPGSPQVHATGTGQMLLASTNVQGGAPSGNHYVDNGGNLNADPLFVDATGADGQAGTADDLLALLAGSPSLNAGDPNLLPKDDADLDGDGNTTEALPLDLAGMPRVVDGVVDMGAYEGPTAPPNTPPVAQDDAVTATASVPLLINVLANDTDADGETLFVDSVGSAAYGATEITEGQVRYTAAADYAGADSFTYVAGDGNGGIAEATVFVTVNPANVAPVAQNDTATTSTGIAAVIDVLANDTDAEDDSLSITSVSTPDHGTASESGGFVTYTPEADYTGEDVFTYTIEDESGGRDTAAVAVTVNPTANVSVTVPLAAGWNLLSVPTEAADMGAGALFPAAASSAFAFEDGYVSVDSLESGRGYWLKFDRAGSAEITGATVDTKEVAVATGWNLVGFFDTDHPVASAQSEPAGIITSNFFTYEVNGYAVTSMLEPGRGYWVKADAAGTISFGTAPAGKRSDALTSVSSAPDSSWLRLDVTDAAGQHGTLYLAPGDAEGRFVMPPRPPEGAFDLRFATDRWAEAEGKPHAIRLQGAAYPVTLRATNLGADRTAQLRDALGAGLFEGAFREGEALVLRESVGQLTLEVTALPKSFVLHGAFPNPMRDQATIRYALPEARDVRLDVFDVMGRRVATLVDERQEAGRQQIRLDAAALPAGVYFYRLDAGAYSETRRLVRVR